MNTGSCTQLNTRNVYRELHHENYALESNQDKLLIQDCGHSAFTLFQYIHAGFTIEKLEPILVTINVNFNQFNGQ